MSVNTDLPPPVPPKHIPSIVETLDPDLAAAYRSGNAAIISAVAGGATSTSMVVSDMIRMGVTTGLPGGVQELVSARLKEMEQQNAAGNKAVVATVVAFEGILASNIAQGAPGYGEGGYNPAAMDFTKSSDEMSDRERRDFFNNAAKMTVADYNKLSQDQKQRFEDNVIEQGTRMTNEARDASDRFADDLSRLTPAQQQAVSATTDSLDFYARDAQGRLIQPLKFDAAAAAAARLEAEKEKDEDVKRMRLEAIRIEQLRTQGMSMISHAQAEPNGPNHGANLIAAAQIADSNLSLRNAVTLTAQQKAAYQSDVAMTLDASAAGGAVGTENRDIRASKDQAIVVAQAKTGVALATDDYDAAPVVAAAPRKTIDATPLATVGMLQEPGVVANDPKGPGPERPRVQAPVQAMGSAG